MASIECRTPDRRLSTRDDQPGGPIVIGHRGASGYRPEHTMASYELAIAQGADFIEPDLVCTGDGHLIARHESELSRSTDVSRRPEFADRRVRRRIDGLDRIGWFAEDFTLAEVSTLRAIERLPQLRPDNTRYDGTFAIPTLADICELAGRTGVGLVLELKSPGHTIARGLPVLESLSTGLTAAGLVGPDARVIVESFETSVLRRLHATLDVAIVQLLDDHGAPQDLVEAADPRSYADLATPAGLAAIAGYAQGIAPRKSLLIPRAVDGTLGTATELTDDAHAAGLAVLPFTFRAENHYLPAELRRPGGDAVHGGALEELHRFLALGIDGLFTDQPDLAVRARSAALLAA